MNWTAVGITFSLVVLQGIFAWKNGVLTRTQDRKIRMPFLYHGGMWSDAFIMPWIIGLSIDHVDSKFGPWLWLVVGGSASVLTVLLHAAWGANSRARYQEHMWTRTYRNHSILDLNMAGILHVFFMAGTLTIVTMFLCSSPPRFNLWSIAFLLTLHWPLAVFLPGWVKSDKWFDPMSIASTASLIAITWGVTAYKL